MQRTDIAPHALPETSIERRARIADWLNKRDTALAELWSGGQQIIVGWRAVDYFEGVNVAPFTSSPLLRLSGGVWFYALFIMGTATLLALMIGLLTGNTYRLRSWVALCSCIVWAAVAVATISAPGPLSVGFGYCLPAVVAIISAVVLFVRTDIKERAQNVEAHKRGY